MTFRAKPVVKRTHRPTWETRDRRNFYTNLGFGLVVVVAVVILGVAAAATWYGDHLAPVASVNGQTITRDDFRRRLEIEDFRYEQAENRVRAEFAAGRLTAEQQDAQLQLLLQRRQQIGAIVLERLIDARVTGVLAGQEGVTISEADIDAQLTKEATLPEQRHAWVIEVEPKIDEGKDEPTAEQKAAARTTAEKALGELESGKAWEDVAKALSTASTAAIGGDLGWVSKEFGLDENYLDAIFGLKDAGRTGIVEGDDGTFRIGRVTEIVPESIDEVYRDSIASKGIDVANYRAAVRTELTLDALEKKITDAALGPTVQRRVAEIYIQAPEAEPLDGAVKTRHILYSPNDDPNKAKDVKAEDPAWAKAEADARAAHARIKADPKLFDEIARQESDESSADITGGKLGYLDPTAVDDPQILLDPDFAAAIFKDGLTPGQLLEPVKSAFGWHVIQVMYFPPDLVEAKALKTKIDSGSDFGRLARDFSEGAEAKDGGVLGWVARNQLRKESEDAIFATAIGKVSEPLEIDADGIYLFKVLEEKTRTPDGDQKATIEQTAFSNWYVAKRDDFDIKREIDFSTGAS